MTRQVHRAGVFKAIRLQEEQTRQSKSGASFRDADGPVWNFQRDLEGVLRGIQNKKISAKISTGNRWTTVPKPSGRVPSMFWCFKEIRLGGSMADSRASTSCELVVCEAAGTDCASL